MHIKVRNVLFFKIPNYTKLGVKNVWLLIKQNNDLLNYFPNLEASQLPEKEFM